MLCGSETALPARQNRLCLSHTLQSLIQRHRPLYDLSRCLNGCQGFCHPAYTVHYRLPGDGSYTLWVLCSNGSWQQQSYETDGSYLLLKHGGDSVTFCVTAQGGEKGLILLIAVCTLMLILILVFLERSRRKRKREKAVQTETDPLAQNMSDVVG